MSFFSKLKKSFSHGGVSIDLQAPASVAMHDASVPVAVTVTAGEQPAHINGVRAEIFEESQNQSQVNNNSTAIMTPRSVSYAENNQPFDLAPGQSQVVNLGIIMNVGAAISTQLPKDSAAASVAHGLQQLQSFSEAMSGTSYNHYLQVSAKVEGVTFEPSKRQPIQLVKPGQIGAGFNINL